jgi:micrococcal nuclease
MAVLLILTLAVAGCSQSGVNSTTPTTTQPTPVTTPLLSTRPTPTPFSPEFGVKYEVEVVRVIDGDTIDVLLPDGTQERVRMLCVDTPETTAENNEPYEYGSIDDLDCLAEWGQKAKQFTKSWLEGKTSYIEFDETAGLRDYYGRLLAYIYIDETDFTAELVKRGYARVYEEGECKKESEYIKYQQSAVQSKTGLWSCGYVTTTTTTSPGGCDPSYPDVCIPPPPPDLDCKDVPFRNFRVLPPDPHNFDRDKDGIGCES